MRKNKTKYNSPFTIHHSLDTKHGFTLVEMLIVVTIFAIIGVGVASSFFAGMKLWDRARNVDFTQSNALLSLDLIGRELRQAVNMPDFYAEGTSDELSFVTLNNSIVEVTYRFDAGQKVLLRSEAGIDSFFEGSESIASPEEEVLLIDEVSFSYSYFDEETESYETVDIWEDQEDIFDAVMMKIKIKDYEFTKTVFIPISSYVPDPKSETIIKETHTYYD
ncbi:MAG: prepilin-type N-terminal cleavage/methylation domain-containing protein [PVC group bacterium]|nr:prepilin-type N-terminal cleavage/methylation domain-containing protein [PVC group bacterium]